MRSTVILYSSFALAGCAGATHSSKGAASADDAAAPRVVQALQRETEEQARRISELEARLSLLENEARAYRQHTPAKPAATVRIGGGAKDGDRDEPLHRRAVPVVRLHERDVSPSNDEPLVLPEAPPGMAAKLGVVPLPHERASQALASEPLPGSAGEGARGAYRAALRLLRDRRWDDAFAAFGDFLRAHPEHELAANATYWRGEARYAQRRYADALTDFVTVISRFARSEKAADALFKLGMCQRRLGDEAAAARSFQKLKQQYPSSEAARIASRENAS